MMLQQINKVMQIAQVKGVHILIFIYELHILYQPLLDSYVIKTILMLCPPLRCYKNA